MSDLQATTDRDAGDPGPELPLADGVWSVDPQRSEIGFDVKALWGIHTVRGVFGAYDGTLTVQAGGAAGNLTIDAASLDTGHGSATATCGRPTSSTSSRTRRSCLT